MNQDFKVQESLLKCLADIWEIIRKICVGKIDSLESFDLGLNSLCGGAVPKVEEYETSKQVEICETAV